jgi:hypothetical protein
MKRLAAAGVLALGAWAALAQPAPQPPASAPANPDCPAAADMEARHLYGLWRVQFAGAQQANTVLFEKHPEMAGSVRGGINRDGKQALLAGDVDEGVLVLDESDDGLHISAVWSGNVSPSSCGKEIRGTWTNVKDKKETGFVLHKAPGWR